MMTSHRRAVPSTWLMLPAVLLPVLLAPANSSADTWDPVEQAPGLAPQRVIVKGKPRVYFRATERAPIEFTLHGPARIKFVTRAEPAPGGSGQAVYAVRVSESGRELKVHRTESGPANGTRLESTPPVALCKSRTFVLSISDGPHRLTLSESGVPAVYVRLLVAAPKQAGEAMVSITPVEAARSVTVSEGERLIPYYSVLEGKPVRLRIVGPTRLELSSRLDFDATMRGEHWYTLRIQSGTRPLRDVRFRTTKAVAASYTDLKSRIPSKLDRIVLNVGPGLNDITVALLQPRSGAAEIHARIPQPTVGSEE